MTPPLYQLSGWVQSQVAAKTAFPGAPFLPRYNGTYIKDADSAAPSSFPARHRLRRNKKGTE